MKVRCVDCMCEMVEEHYFHGVYFTCPECHWACRIVGEDE